MVSQLDAIIQARKDLDKISKEMMPNFLLNGTISGPFSDEWQRLWMVISTNYLALRFHETFVLYQQPNEWKISIDVLSTWFTIPEGSGDVLKSFVKNNEISIRRNFILNFMFETEAFVKKINSKLDSPTTDTKYSDLIKHVLKSLELEDYNTKLDAMKGASLIRNALHDGGVHMTFGDNVTIKGKNYRFIQGEETFPIYWKVLVIFLEELISVLNEIDKKFR